MLDGTEELLTLAEIGVALAGFAALVVVLAGRGHAVHPTTAFLTKSLAVNAVGAALFCITPVVVARLGVSEPAVWRLSSALAALVGLLVGWPGVAYSLRQLRRRLAAGPPDAPAVGLPIVVLATALTALPFGLFIGMSLGFPIEASLGGFLLAIHLFLVVSCLEFIWALLVLLP